MNSVGVVAASQCPFTMEVMFWYFVKETCKVITTAILRFVLVLFEQMQNLANHLFVEFSGEDAAIWKESFKPKFI
jgi:hypothetical protein